jgi:hypothetical protein
MHEPGANRPQHQPAFVRARRNDDECVSARRCHTDGDQALVIGTTPRRDEDRTPFHQDVLDIGDRHAVLLAFRSIAFIPFHAMDGGAIE